MKPETSKPNVPTCSFQSKHHRQQLRTVLAVTLTLKAFMLRKKGLIDQPSSLGQHLRNRRLILGLHQEDVARLLGSVREVYDRWERDERQPVVSEWPGILLFLGYYPAPEESATDLVLKARRCQGLDQKHLANSVGVIHQRLRRWERGSKIPDEVSMLHLAQLAQLPSAMI